MSKPVLAPTNDEMATYYASLGDGHLNGKIAANRLQIIDLRHVPDEPPPQDVIAGVIPADFPSSIFGAGGQLKSYLLTHMMMCVVAGQPFLGRKVVQSPVLFVDYELDAKTTAHRARQIARGMGLTGIPAGFGYVNASRSLLKLTDQLLVEIEQTGFGWLGIDSMGLAIAGDTQKEDGVIAAMGALRALEIASTVVDHQAKVQPGQDYAGKEAFGSVYKGNLVRASWQLYAPKDQGQDKSIRDLVMRQAKWSFGPEGANIGIRATFAGDTLRFEEIDPATSTSLTVMASTKDRLIQAVNDDPGSAAEALADLTGIALGTTRNVLRELKADGRLVYVQPSGEHKPGTWQPMFYSEPIPGRASGRESGGNRV
jgi:hypothetical protein